MRFVLLLCVLGTLVVPSSALAGGVVSAFYYPWFSGAGSGDNHWAQNGFDPPDDIASNYYPALGVYSSGSSQVLDQQMTEIHQAGIDEIAVSWWGSGSLEDERLPTVLASATAHHVAVAVQLEPYQGRSVASTVADVERLFGSYGIKTYYLYNAFVGVDPSDWATALDTLRAQGLTVFAQTGLVGQAVAGHFSGVYTYDILTYGPSKLARYCAEAHAHALLCAPSVGPGFDAFRATGNPHILPRLGGKTYDRMWRAAIAAGADRVTITSFNEWQEGTQIEPASPPLRMGDVRYGSYNGAWGLAGAAASTAYLDRTAHWTAIFHEATPAGP